MSHLGAKVPSTTVISHSVCRDHPKKYSAPSLSVRPAERRSALWEPNLLIGRILPSSSCHLAQPCRPSQHDPPSVAAWPCTSFVPCSWAIGLVAGRWQCRLPHPGKRDGSELGTWDRPSRRSLPLLVFPALLEGLRGVGR